MWICRGLICVIVICQMVRADHKPKKFRIDLDGDPYHRWDEVIAAHKEFIPEVAKQSREFIPKELQPFVWWVAKQLRHRFPKEYSRELEGIAAASDLPLGEIVGLNILYDITAFDRGHIFSHLACTSIVAEDATGRIWHGRNLDYEMGGLLKNITVVLDFTRNGTVVYSGTTFVLYNGLLTGVRPDAFSISLNARYSGAYIDNILMELYTRFKRPVSFFIRETLEGSNSFAEAVDTLSKTSFICPSYITIGGIRKGEGAVISRNRLNSADIEWLDSSAGRWFLVETNFDHWKVDHDPRRIRAVEMLSSMSPTTFDSAYMMKVLSTSPVRNNMTIYSTVISARYPQLMWKSIRVID